MTWSGAERILSEQTSCFPVICVYLWLEHIFILFYFKEMGIKMIPAKIWRWFHLVITSFWVTALSVWQPLGSTITVSHTTAAPANSSLWKLNSRVFSNSLIWWFKSRWNHISRQFHWKTGADDWSVEKSPNFEVDLVAGLANGMAEIPIRSISFSLKWSERSVLYSEHGHICKFWNKTMKHRRWFTQQRQ